MITDADIKRINELYHKSKSEGLTPDEKQEQVKLREAYIESVRANMRRQLNNIEPELRRLLDSTKVHLAVSLHNPFHEERAAIMPVERAWPVAEVAAILRRYDFTHQRRVSFEYIVMSGLNDSPRHIRELCRLLDGIKCRINLIRFHKIPGSPYFSPDDAAMVRLRDTLTAKGIQTTIRASRGEDIQAACGLLSTSALEGGQ